MVYAMPDTLKNQYLDTSQAAHYLGFSKSTLEWWRTLSPRRGPDFHKLGGRVRYRISELDAWVNDSRVEARG